VGPIGSAVLTFIGYKQTDRHPDREAKFKHKWGKFNLQTELGMNFTIIIVKNYRKQNLISETCPHLEEIGKLTIRSVFFIPLIETDISSILESGTIG